MSERIFYGPKNCEWHFVRVKIGNSGQFNDESSIRADIQSRNCRLTVGDPGQPKFGIPVFIDMNSYKAEQLAIDILERSVNGWPEGPKRYHASQLIGYLKGSIDRNKSSASVKAKERAAESSGREMRTDLPG